MGGMSKERQSYSSIMTDVKYVQLEVLIPAPKVAG